MPRSLLSFRQAVRPVAERLSFGFGATAQKQGIAGFNQLT